MPNPQTPIIGVHLDLKGVQFRRDYLLQLPADLASQGVNTLLVEYEDVFPFSNLDIAADPAATWQNEFLQEFLAKNREHGIEVIPLQQCLGHLEYLLLRGYEHFAIDEGDHSTIDVTNDAAKALVKSMLEQVIAAHPESKYVMLGMDEAYGLISYARRHNLDVLAMFLDYLEELCSLCEKHGKTPMIWSDMLEDHLSAQTLPLMEKFRERVILVPWDYNSLTEKISVARIGGARISREWLDEPGNLQSPAVGSGTQFFEDLPEEIQGLVAPYRQGRYFKAMFQADLWTSLGFRVVGGSALRMTGDGNIFPNYNRRRDNIELWSKAYWRNNRGNNMMGQIATSWARCNTVRGPNYSFDLGWPLIETMADTMGASPDSFFAGVPSETVQTIITKLGRCRVDWQIEEQVVEEMESLKPKLKSHAFEWQSLILAAKTLAFTRQSGSAMWNVAGYECNNRSTAATWQQRRQKLEGVLSRLQALRDEVAAHFGKRYEGEAFEEWLRELYDGHRHRLEESCRIVDRKVAELNQPSDRRNITE